MTMTEKILAAHAGCEKVEPGQLIRAKTDFLLANDITGPQAIPEFDKIGRPVFDPDKIALIPDHFVPNKDIKSAEQAKALREFARKHKITHYVEAGRMGIEHALLPEQGFFRTHKGYIVNLSMIYEIETQDNGTLLLTMNRYPKEKVPVSRHYIKDFRTVMHMK